MAGTSEGGRRAARARGHQSLAEAGRKGGRNSQRKRANQSNKRRDDNQDNQK